VVIHVQDAFAALFTVMDEYVSLWVADFNYVAETAFAKLRVGQLLGWRHFDLTVILKALILTTFNVIELVFLAEVPWLNKPRVTSRCFKMTVKCDTCQNSLLAEEEHVLVRGVVTMLPVESISKSQHQRKTQEVDSKALNPK